jgi:hypothetical protein
MIKILALFTLLVALHLLLLFNFQFTAWPEMFSFPYLINHGFKLYKDIAMPYQPLLPIILSWVYNLTGYKEEVLRSVTWLLIIISDGLIFTISLKLLGKKLISILPLLFFVLIQPLAEGNMLWFDLATVPFMLLGLAGFVLLKSNLKFLWLGLFLSLAFLIKQQTGIAITLLGLYFLIIQRPFTKVILFGIGLLIPLILIICYVLLNGIWGDYFFWTTEVPLVWYPKFPGYTHIPSLSDLVKMILIFAPGLWIIKSFANKLKSNLELATFVLLFIGAFLTAFPRFEFFRLQPAIAMFAVLLTFVFINKKKALTIFIPIFIVVLLLFKHNLAFYHQPTRFFAPNDIAFANEISTVSNSEKIYLLGVSSLTYVLANKFPAKPWIDNYIWYMEIPGMQDKVISGLDEEKIQYIYWKRPELGLWYKEGTYQPKQIVDYINNNFRKVGQVNSEVDIWQRK